MPIKDLKVDLEGKEQDADIRAKKEVLSRILQGNWNTLLKGQGMEFAGFRTYTFEDDASLIDWKATLRSDEILVREFEEHKTINVIVMVDVSDTMLFTSQDKLKAEYAAELGFALSDAILKAGDAVGMAMFTDHLVENIPPNIGKGSHILIRRALENPMNYGGKSNLKNVMKLLNATVAERSLIIIISDFIGLEKGWQTYLDIIAQRMDVLGIMLRDPRDKDFTMLGGQFELQDPNSGHVLLVDTTKYAPLFRDEVNQEEKIIER
ncbi:DUF58 domain-containing protein, partial [Nanoarchaeota archaeon]